MTISHGESETYYARERVIELLEESSFELVTDGLDDERGWRGEFLRSQGDGDVILLTHKPDGAPYLSIATQVPVDPVEDLGTLLEVVEVTSDFDVSFFFPDSGRGGCQLTDRVFVSSLNRDDFHFQLSNLLVCRDTLLDLLTTEEA